MDTEATDQNIQKLIPQLMKFLEENDLIKALDISRQIISFCPSSPHYYYNHAMLCVDLGMMPEAAEGFRQARDRLPNCPVIRRMLADTLLDIGQFREGLENLEWRFNWPLPDSPTPLAPMPIVIELIPRLRACFPGPYWNGVADLRGKTILVFNEAGHGDIIQNCRYLPQLKARGAKVILDVKEEVYKILKNIKGVDEVITFKKTERIEQFVRTFTNLGLKLELPPHDYVVSIHSLLYYFDPDVNKIPSEFPYIWPEPSDCEAAKIVRDNKSKLKVGIVWAGNDLHGSDEHRSTYKRSFLPLMSVPGIQLFSLQKGKMDRNWPSGRVNLLDGGEVVEAIDLGPLLLDYADTAAVLNELDATVAVDTSVSHLAGAMNLPVWTVLPDLRWTDWRWQRRWYATQRVIAQDLQTSAEQHVGRVDAHCQEWQALLERVASELVNLCSDKNST